MAKAEVENKPDWILSNPWFWLGTGFTATCLAAIWVRILGDSLDPLRFFLIAIGLLGTGICLIIRLNSSGPAFLATLKSAVQQTILSILFALYTLLALLVTAMMVIALVNGSAFGYRIGVMVVTWFVMVPMCASAAQVAMGHLRDKKPLSRWEEISVMMTLTATVLLLCSWSLYLGPERADNWDTMRSFFAMVALVPMIAAPLVVVPLNVRRAVISGLVVLHFGGICTAVMANPPSAWIVIQVWGRFYRPYLEFMYLNNAYHFYSPEPGPAHQVWFRIYYENPDAKSKEKKMYARWYLIPKMDSDGFQGYKTNLTFHRYLAQCQNTVLGTIGSTPSPAELVRRFPGISVPGVSPDYAMINGVRVPGNARQFQRPDAKVKRLYSSMARFACRLPCPGHPELKAKKVRIYRVSHAIPSPDTFHFFTRYKGGSRDPQDPIYYFPYYMGEFDCEGNLLPSSNDGFLYWLLPNARESEDRPWRSYVLLHASDPRWDKLTGRMSDAFSDDEDEVPTRRPRKKSTKRDKNDEIKAK